MLQNRNWIMGLWKFRDSISIQELGAVADHWASEDPHYLQLYIRKTSKDQRGIGFTYEMGDGADPKRSEEEYFDRTADFLKRRFGNDLVGWDLAAAVVVIK